MSDSRFSAEEEELRQKFLQSFKDMDRREEKYWEEEYPLKSREEKVNEWLAGIHTGMRYQGESTGDEYTQFSPQWYRLVKSREPDFDEIFKDVVKRLGREFNWDEYKRRILA
jgi:hypothetical protein